MQLVEIGLADVMRTVDCLEQSAGHLLDTLFPFSVDAGVGIVALGAPQGELVGVGRRDAVDIDAGYLGG